MSADGIYDGRLTRIDKRARLAGTAAQLEETVTTQKGGRPLTFGQHVAIAKATDRAEVVSALKSLADTAEAALANPDDDELSDELRLRAVMRESDLVVKSVASALTRRRLAIEKQQPRPDHWAKGIF